MKTHYHPTPATSRTGTLALLLGCTLLGTIGIFVHHAHASPLTATWFRCLFGLAGLTLWLLSRRQIHSLRLSKTTAPLILTASLLIVLSWGLFFTAIEHIPAGVAIVLFHLQPLWLLLLGALWLKEPVSRQRLVFVLIAMSGLVLATGVLGQTPWSGGKALPPGYLIGIVLCLTGAFFTACVTLIAKRLHGMPTGVLAWWQCLVGTVILWVWPVTHGWPAWGSSWIWLAGLGLIHTGLAYVLIYIGTARLSTSRIALFQFTYPAVALTVDWLVLNQPLDSLQLSGIVLMAGAIWLAERTPTGKRSTPPAKQTPVRREEQHDNQGLGESTE